MSLPEAAAPNRGGTWVDLTLGESPLAEQTKTILESLTGLTSGDLAWLLSPHSVGFHLKDVGQAIGLRIAIPYLDESGDLHYVRMVRRDAIVVTAHHSEPDMMDLIRQRLADRQSIGSEPNVGVHLFTNFAYWLLTTWGRWIISTQGLLEQLTEQARFIDSVHGDAARARIARQKAAGIRKQIQRFRIPMVDLALSLDDHLIGVDSLPGFEPDDLLRMEQLRPSVSGKVQQITELRHAAHEVMHAYSDSVAEEQGEQMNRLTVLAAIFLPLSFLTGYFGMNFSGMTTDITGIPKFIVLGILLPLGIAVWCVVFFKRRGLLVLPARPRSRARAGSADERP